MAVIHSVGVDPVHVGFVMVRNLMMGTLTPPVGIVPFVVSRVAKLPFKAVTRATASFLIPLIVLLSLIAAFPELVLWLPRELPDQHRPIRPGPRQADRRRDATRTHRMT